MALLVERTRELERVVEELDQAQQRAELVQVAGALAHDVRNPLNVVGAHVALLLEEARSQGRPTATLELVSAKVGEAEAGLRRFLDLSRPTVLDLKPTALAGLLAGFQGFLRPKCAQAGVELLLSVEPGLPDARADGDALQRCLLDLCLNALQAAPPPRSLLLRAESRRFGVLLSVSDDGPGIPEGLLPSIFTPYASGRAGGTGLGLYSVRRLCRAMGGGIVAGNLHGRGSRFCVWLPAVPAPKEGT